MPSQLTHPDPSLLFVDPSYLYTMDLPSKKIELAKRLLETEDEEIIRSVEAVFARSDEFSGEWGDLPDEVIADAKESLRQIKAGKGIPHEQARETYKKWL